MNKNTFQEKDKVMTDYKISIGLNCKCNEEDCAKCLSVNCVEDNCPTHTQYKKKKTK